MLHGATLLGEVDQREVCTCVLSRMVEILG